jgi:hypothetical protein
MSGTSTGETTAPLRLTRGEIPSNWSQPAEAVTQLPQSSRRPMLSATIALVGVAFCVGFAIVMIPAKTTTQPSPATPAPGLAPGPVVAPVVTPAPVTEIPVPPKTSSTTPINNVAPEDQGGEPVAKPAPTTASSDTPARTKAKAETAKAIKLLASGDAAGAEKPLIRATLADKTFPDAWRHLGIARAQLGDRAGAKRAYKRYLELAPNAPDAADVRKILAE